MNSTQSKRYAYFGNEGIGGGLTSENPIIASPSQVVIGDNVLVGTSVARRKRGGLASYHSSTYQGTAQWPTVNLPIRGIYEFWQTSGFAQPQSFIMAYSDDKIWSIDGRAEPAVDITGSLSLPATGTPCFQPFGGVLFTTSTDTSHGYVSWEGTGNAGLAQAPADGAGKYICNHLGRMFMGGNLDFPFRVYYSSVLDPTVWVNGGGFDGGSFDLVDDGDPEGITGLASFQNRLYIFTRHSIHELTGTSISDFVIQRVSNGIGCLGHATIAQTPNDVIFCSDRGVHSLRQIEAGRVTTSQFLSRDIQRLWTDLLNSALYSRIYAVYDETINNYIITVPSSGQTKNDQILCYNIEFGSWWIWKDVNARSITTTLINNKKNLLVGTETGGILLLNQSGRNDLGNGYTSRWKTGVIYPGNDLTSQKRFISITVIASTTKPGSFSIGWTIDGIKSGSRAVDLSAGEDLLGSTFVLGQSKLGIGQYTPKTIGIEDIGYGIQIEISSTGTSDIEFYGFFMEVEDVNQVYR